MPVHSSISTSTLAPERMPSKPSGDIPSVGEIYEQLGYRSKPGLNTTSNRPAKQLQELIRPWRNEYRTVLGEPGKELIQWNRDQSALRTMASTFLRTNKNGITQWPRVNHSAPDAPKYEEDEERIIDLLSQLFWRQNVNNAHNVAKKPSHQTACQGIDRIYTPYPDRPGASKLDIVEVSSDDSDDGFLSSIASQNVKDAMDFLKDEDPSPPQNDGRGVLRASLSPAGVVTRSTSRRREGGPFGVWDDSHVRGRSGAPGSVAAHAGMERATPAKRKRTPSGAQPPRAPTVPGPMLRMGSPQTQETAFVGPSRAGSRSSPGREVPDAGSASTGQKATEPDPLPNIRYLILVKSRPRPRRISWANATLRDRSMDDLFEEVAKLAEVKDIQQIKFTLHGLEQDYTAKKMDRRDGVAFADMLDSWGESMHEEMHAPVKANFIFDIVLELELPEAHEEGGPEVKDPGTSRRARKQYSKLIF